MMLQGREGGAPLRPSKLEQRWANCPMRGWKGAGSGSGALPCLSPHLSTDFAAQTIDSM